jgi:hypothetical protein
LSELLHRILGVVFLVSQFDGLELGLDSFA